MAGVRLAAPLQVLRAGAAEWVVGLVLALFALGPVALSLHAGRMADRHGFHRPMRIAVALVMTGAAIAALTASVSPSPPLGWLVVAALLVGGGSNFSLIAIQRTAGQVAKDRTQRLRVFSWLGLAPAAANVVGPVLVGWLIDLAGFRAAYVAMAVLPLASLFFARLVPQETSSARSARAHEAEAAAQRPLIASARELLMRPGMRRLLLVNWLISACWDVHAFLVPVLGHERALSASAIGTILGVFAASVAGVRLVIPLVAQHLRETTTLRIAMLQAAAVFIAYPFAPNALSMAVLAAVLGLALGCVQPMIMSALHRLTPSGRHGEAVALRSMALNLASTVMPALFGLVGTASGTTALFWAMGTAVGSGSALLRRLRDHLREASSPTR